MTQQVIPALRSQDVVFTLYGDYLLPRERPVWVGSLITLLGELGLSPMAVRTVLSRMARKGWLTVERRGPRSYYGLTRRGRKLLEEGRERIYHPRRDQPWDGSWYLITYTIPEARRRLRDQLRVRLSWLGCGALTNGLWITPHDVRNEVRETAESLRLLKNVEVFRAEHLGYSDAGRLVEQCWDLGAISERYGAFVSRWRGDFEHCRQCGVAGGQGPVPSGCITPAACFRRRFLLVHEYRAFPLEDPFLPHALLPGDWEGEEAARLFDAYQGVLAEPAVRFVAEACAVGDSDYEAPPRAAGST